MGLGEMEEKLGWVGMIPSGQGPCCSEYLFRLFSWEAHILGGLVESGYGKVSKVVYVVGGIV